MDNSLAVDILDGSQDLCHIKSRTVLVEGSKLVISKKGSKDVYMSATLTPSR